MNFLKKSGILLIALSLILSGCAGGAGGATADSAQEDNSQPAGKAEKVIVIHFHATQQCWSCIKVGELALKTIQEKFPEEYANGTIVFKEINGELRENNNIVVKYQARGSSLFVNAIIDGQDNISEDTNVWRLVSNEAQYIDYFGNTLSNSLGK